MTEEWVRQSASRAVDEVIERVKGEASGDQEVAEFGMALLDNKAVYILMILAARAAIRMAFDLEEEK